MVSNLETYWISKKVTRSARLSLVIALIALLVYFHATKPEVLQQRVKYALRIFGRHTADRLNRGNASSLAPSSKCFRSPFVLCTDHTDGYSNIFYYDGGRADSPMVNRSQVDGSAGGGGPGEKKKKKKKKRGMWKIAAKLRRGAPVVFNFINHPSEFHLPEPNLPCLRNACVFRRGALTEEDDVVDVRALGLGEGHLPKKRWDGQLFLYDELESPSNYVPKMRYFDSKWRYQFNLTTTYLTSSDIFHPYNPLKFEPIPLELKPNYRAIAEEKTKNVIWLVSNCNSMSRREEYVEHMKKTIDVDIFGACGNSTDCSGQRVPCLQTLFKPYRFYLAFENSLCQDYVSEKFFKVFAPGLHIVPVVLGRATYSRHFPPKSFVDTGDFRTPAELSEHLQRLAANASAYGEMLRVADEYTSQDSPNHFCTMCSAVTSLRLKPRVYDIYHWVSGQCAEEEDRNGTNIFD